MCGLRTHTLSPTVSPTVSPHCASHCASLSPCLTHLALCLCVSQTQQNVYIKHAIELEQYLMEGAYNKVIHARQSIPAEPYAYFMDLLMHTVRCALSPPPPLPPRLHNRYVLSELCIGLDVLARRDGWCQGMS
jgi:hypothetical protein